MAEVRRRAWLCAACLLVAACGGDDGSASEGAGDSESDSSGSPTETDEGLEPCAEALAQGELGQSLYACGFDPELHESWAWVREEPDAWTLDQGVLSITSLFGTLSEIANSTRNIAAVDPPAGDFIVTVTITGTVAIDAEQGGLMLYGGDDDYVKLTREMVGSTKSAVLVTEAAGLVAIEAFVAVDTDDLRLQLERSGDSVIARFQKLDDVDWQVLGQLTPSLPGSPRVALFSQGDPGGGRSSQFSDFSLSP